MRAIAASGLYRAVSHGVQKHVPNESDLRTAWKRAWRITELNKAINLAAKAIPEPPEPPDNLVGRVSTALERDPTQRWDKVLLEPRHELQRRQHPHS